MKGGYYDALENTMGLKTQDTILSIHLYKFYNYIQNNGVTIEATSFYFK